MPQPRSNIRRPDRGSPVVTLRKTSAETAEETAAAALTLQFLAFIADGRTYGETMEAWRSTCPRMPIWENALRHGLVRIENGSAMNSSRIVLTALGTKRLRQAPTLPYPSPSSGRVAEPTGPAFGRPDDKLREVGWGSLGRRRAAPPARKSAPPSPKTGRDR
jgi:hypothetical protein